MSECPNCNKEINNLIYKGEIQVKCIISHDKPNKYLTNYESNSWQCPKCDVILNIDSELEAHRFLLGINLKEGNEK